MQLGWIDFSKEDRQKALAVMNLLSEQGAVDELGIGIVRDTFANYFFPGTSTIQTRAKYFLIVPYMLREAVDGRYGKDVSRVLKTIDSAECKSDGCRIRSSYAVGFTKDTGDDSKVIMHWNLPSNPIDLEQREGRINRFKCLAIRQNVAGQYGESVRACTNVSYE